MPVTHSLTQSTPDKPGGDLQEVGLRARGAAAGLQKQLIVILHYSYQHQPKRSEPEQSLTTPDTSLSRSS